MVAITTDDSFYILKYSAEIAANASGEQVTKIFTYIVFFIKYDETTQNKKK